jgi:HK97 gp10 family phage protein
MIEVVSHKASVEKATEKAMKRAARMIGGTVAGHAVDLCPVDTGLLRNSITYAIGGEAPEKRVYYDDNNEQTGEYDGEAERDEDHEITVYIGTNVQYAPYQELGAPNIHLNANPFLRPAMENYKREIEQIIQKELGSLR